MFTYTFGKRKSVALLTLVTVMIYTFIMGYQTYVYLNAKLEKSFKNLKNAVRTQTENSLFLKPNVVQHTNNLLHETEGSVELQEDIKSSATRSASFSKEMTQLANMKSMEDKDASMPSAFKGGNQTFLRNLGSHSNLSEKAAFNEMNTTYHGVDLMALPTYEFDPTYKNPCWKQNGTLRCLPYYFIIGVKKCGTSQLWTNLVQHPDIATPNFKEAQWFARKRFGKRHEDSFDLYIDRFKEATLRIERHYEKDSTGDGKFHYLITGEASPSNLHLNSHWRYLPGNEELDEPKYVILDYIHHFLPNAKIIIIFRDPIERLYSDYYHEFSTLRHYNASPEHFHTLVDKGLHLFEECLNRHSLRSCVYDERIYREVKINIQLGIFHIYWKDLIRVFPKEQILPVQNRDLNDKSTTMKRVYTFLGLDPSPPLQSRNVAHVGHANHRSAKNLQKGDMLKETRRMLIEFYKPHNEEMFRITGDKAFLYTADIHTY